ncbi:hypothetical protein PQX77_004701 [Marasmius sp. AFHP31]|nr:hypothetical protein PQX77_004701 [Marasmius sp. AFHP31]
MAAALDSLPFAAVRTIRVCSNKHGLPAQSIVDQFGSLCQLEKIVITNCAIGFIEAIGRNAVSVTQRSSLTPDFPALHMLELREISLYSPPPNIRRCINGLLAALEWRLKNAAGVRRVVLQRCWYLFRDDVILTNNLVEEVE